MALTLQQVIAKYGLTEEQAKRLDRCDNSPNDNKVEDFILNDFNKYRSPQYIENRAKIHGVDWADKLDKNAFAVFCVETTLYQHQINTNKKPNLKDIEKIETNKSLGKQWVI